MSDTYTIAQIPNTTVTITDAYLFENQSGAGGQSEKNTALVLSNYIKTKLSGGDGISYNSSTGVFDVDYNSTNLKITANQLNIAQDIATSSSPQFIGLNLSGLTASSLLATDGSKNLSVASGTYDISISGNSSTATKLATSRNIGGVGFDGSANIVPQYIQTTDETGDSTCFFLVANSSGSQTSGQQPKTNSGLTYDAVTNKVSATTFGGDLSGNATTATALQNSRNINSVAFDGSSSISIPANTATNSSNATNYVGFYPNNASTNQFTLVNGNLTFNPSTSDLVIQGSSQAFVDVIGNGAGIEAAVTIRRGDSSAYGQTHFYTGATNNFAIGLRSGDSKFHIFDVVNTTEVLNITPGLTPVIKIPSFSSSGVVHNDSLGALTTSLIVNADVASGAGIVDTKLATISTAGKVSNSATTATNANTASTIVSRDSSGNFSAGTITATLNGNASTATSATTATTATTALNVNSNLIVAGNFTTNPWQRGTSGFVPDGSGNSFSADRFALQGFGGSGVYTVDQSTNAPTFAQSGVVSSNSLRATVTTAVSSISSGEGYCINYNFRPQEWAQIAYQTFTLSFWVKSNLTGTYCVFFLDTNSGSPSFDTYLAEYTINAANTWEKKTITVSASPSGYAYTAATWWGFCLGAGSGVQGVANTWGVNSNSRCTSNQVNWMHTNGNTFEIDLIKIELGATAGQYINYPQEDVLLHCQAEFEKSYSQGVTPAAVSTVGMIAIDVGTATTNNLSQSVTYKVEKNSSPTITLYDAAGNSGKVTKGGNNKSGVTANGGTRGFTGSSSDATSSSSMTFHWTASTGY